jgi:hypothetical protein
MPRCSEKTLSGTRCKCSALRDSLFCRSHQPEAMATRKPHIPKPKPRREVNALQAFQAFIYQQEWNASMGRPAYTYDAYARFHEDMEKYKCY